MIDQKDQDNIQIKVIDWGLGISFGNDTLKPLKQYVGSPDYMAPEIIKRNYNEKVDVWSSGIIMFELMSGQVPFIEENMADIIKDIENTDKYSIEK